MKTKLIIEQHIHGCFGIDFNRADSEEIVCAAQQLIKLGVGGFFPTLVTDSIDNIKRQIERIKYAASIQDEYSAKILGVHLEGIFLNPEKKGIHDSDLFLELTKENFQKIEDDFIKIITLAPELDLGLIDYLKSKGIKIQAGHCVGGDLSKCSGVTHLFNAMKPIGHRDESTSLSAMLNNDIYTEIIADGVHLSDSILDLILRVKPDEKIILISDALPITKSDLTRTEFAGKTIFYDGIKATSKDGTIAGSTTLVPDIIKILAQKGLYKDTYINNPYNYHEIDISGEIEWDDNYNIVSVQINGKRI